MPDSELRALFIKALKPHTQREVYVAQPATVALAIDLARREEHIHSQLNRGSSVVHSSPSVQRGRGGFPQRNAFFGRGGSLSRRFTPYHPPSFAAGASRGSGGNATPDGQ